MPIFPIFPNPPQSSPGEHGSILPILPASLKRGRMDGGDPEGVATLPTGAIFPNEGRTTPPTNADGSHPGNGVHGFDLAAALADLRLTAERWFRDHTSVASASTSTCVKRVKNQLAGGVLAGVEAETLESVEDSAGANGSCTRLASLAALRAVASAVWAVSSFGDAKHDVVRSDRAAGVRLHEAATAADVVGDEQRRVRAEGCSGLQLQDALAEARRALPIADVHAAHVTSVSGRRQGATRATSATTDRSARRKSRLAPAKREQVTIVKKAGV